MIKRANGRLVLYSFCKIKLIIKDSLLKIKLKIQKILLKIQNYSFYYYYLDIYFLNKIRILVSLLCNVNTIKQIVVLEASSPYFSLLFIIALSTINSDQSIDSSDMISNLTGAELRKNFNKISTGFSPKTPLPLGHPDYDFKYKKRFTSPLRMD
jgi:hypothetical protein